ncbi:SDR family NAD(P)-dependent oxidoreductase [Nonlabens ponticola]|uniref:SDR family oxidoreductase n=1 Tax=Nonlabens ponticola TaxID=2496866 RepID=A0A3S9MZ42_9FLAO|nr:SDR family oxidoreductase [Nonlabens ponticola]AZQ44362.1 SDR family oxidoreductase [Nonlabens ponticola]
MQHLVNLSGKSALITGSAQGIGLAIATELGLVGANIILSDIDEDQLKDAQHQLKLKNIEASYIILDVTNNDQINKASKEHDIDILINNAGVANDIPSLEYTDDDWHQMMNINLNSTFFCCRDFAQQMIKRGNGGVIVNIASISAHYVVSPENHIGYDVAKAGIVQMTRTLGVNLADKGIRVNSVSPGYTATSILEEVGSDSPETLEHWKSQIPDSQFNDPTEIGKVVAFLASDAASSINATNLMADGGYGAFKS